MNCVYMVIMMHSKVQTIRDDWQQLATTFIPTGLPSSWILAILEEILKL
jgi:hypothetical protein